MKKNTIETNLFKDENELNIFVVHVANMREAVKRYRSNPTELGRKQMQTLESQVDNVLESLPEVEAIFL